MKIISLLGSLFISFLSILFPPKDFFLNEEKARETISNATISPTRAKELLSKHLKKINSSKTATAYGLFYIRNKEYFFLHTYTKPPRMRGYSIDSLSGQIKKVDMQLKYNPPYSRNVMKELESINFTHD